MVDIDLKQLGAEVGLEPRVIRRILRKQFRGAFPGGRYILAEGNELYLKVVEACRASLSKPGSPKAEPGSSKSKTGELEKDKFSKRTAMDDRGFFLMDGRMFALATVPLPGDFHTGDMKTVYLGKAEDLLPILNGEVAKAPAFSTSEQQLAWDGLLDGSSAIPPTEGHDKTASTRHIRVNGSRRRRRKK